MSLNNKKILIAYFSHSGNTQEVANQIREKVGGDLFEIVTVDPYPTQYNAVVQQAKVEKTNDTRPALKANVQNIEKYDVVFIGSPVWWYTVAQAVKTFLDSNNLEGKTIVPFCTHEGGGKANSFIDIQNLAPNSTFLEGIELRGSRVRSSQKDVSNWLTKIGLV